MVFYNSRKGNDNCIFGVFADQMTNVHLSMCRKVSLTSIRFCYNIVSIIFNSNSYSKACDEWTDGDIPILDPETFLCST